MATYGLDLLARRSFALEGIGPHERGVHLDVIEREFEEDAAIVDRRYEAYTTLFLQVARGPVPGKSVTKDDRELLKKTFKTYLHNFKRFEEHYMEIRSIHAESRGGRKPRDIADMLGRVGKEYTYRCYQKADVAIPRLFNAFHAEHFSDAGEHYLIHLSIINELKGDEDAVVAGYFEKAEESGVWAKGIAGCGLRGLHVFCMLRDYTPAPAVAWYSFSGAWEHAKDWGAWSLGRAYVRQAQVVGVFAMDQFARAISFVTRSDSETPTALSACLDGDEAVAYMGALAETAPECHVWHGGCLGGLAPGCEDSLAEESAAWSALSSSDPVCAGVVAASGGVVEYLSGPVAAVAVAGSGVWLYRSAEGVRQLVDALFQLLGEVGTVGGLWPGNPLVTYPKAVLLKLRGAVGGEDAKEDKACLGSYVADKATSLLSGIGSGIGRVFSCCRRTRRSPAPVARAPERGAAPSETSEVAALKAKVAELEAAAKTHSAPVAPPRSRKRRKAKGVESAR
jgi:hypothetical protein